MRYIKWIGAVVGVVLLGGALIFFGNFYSKNSSKVESQKSKTTVNNKITTKKGIKLTGSNSDDQYKSVIKDGNYLVGKARGVTANQNGNQYNTVNFENGLLDVARKHFSPKSYIFQEGQYLDTKTAQSWLKRKSHDNPSGLNPEDNGKTDDGRNPYYLQSIEEQDFMTQEDSTLKLKGIVLGLAMNTEDIYQKEEYGVNFTQKIEDSTRIAKGKEIAAEVVARYRKMEGISNNTPIVVAMFSQSSDDSLAGGSFYSYVESKSGTKLGNFKSINEKNVVLPMQENTKNYQDMASGLNTQFVNFQNNIQGFFPNVSYVTGTAKYNDKDVKSLKVDITTQFYSQTEMDSFSNYVAQTAPSFLPTNLSVQIRIKTVEGVQTVLVQKSNSKTYDITRLESD
ncbi:sex pheromone biosynthesis protein [Weissella koreensis KACC 15510]|uniref:CamS family sex pheromone protein n=1 Tax=Weissella koreensis TaxID=165096 RepID=UPI000217571D|nr:CamS family sex pheromone protein [Weissella koreensis]AEJ24096.1 sex pheromone biosynthesis protein [Weissella koreensis KACC 15510]